MNKLKDLLSELNSDSTVDTIESTFSKIAKLLLFKSYIKTAVDKYRILELEFYFKNKNHDDDVTIPRTTIGGMWWLHEWGVDISFNSKEKEFYGGILIRSILPLKDNDNKVEGIYGPRNCCWELFYSSALEQSTSPQIIVNEEQNNYSGEIGITKRYITGKRQGINGNYRFYVKNLDLNIGENYNASPWETNL